MQQVQLVMLPHKLSMSRLLMKNVIFSAWVACFFTFIQVRNCLRQRVLKGYKICVKINITLKEDLRVWIIFPFKQRIYLWSYCNLSLKTDYLLMRLLNTHILKDQKFFFRTWEKMTRLWNNLWRKRLETFGIDILSKLLVYFWNLFILIKIIYFLNM